jgi:hypothetical protein
MSLDIAFQLSKPRTRWLELSQLGVYSATEVAHDFEDHTGRTRPAEILNFHVFRATVEKSVAAASHVICGFASVSSWAHAIH